MAFKNEGFLVQASVEQFDCGDQVGVALRLADGAGHAIRWTRNETPASVGFKFRQMADWLDPPKQIEPRFESFAHEAKLAKGSL